MIITRDRLHRGVTRERSAARGDSNKCISINYQTILTKYAMPDSEERVLSELRIRIDRTACIGTQNCVHVAPEVFVLGADQIVTFCEDSEDIEQDRLVEACAICPVDALSAFYASGEQVVPWK